MWVSELVSESWHEIQIPAGKNKKKKERKKKMWVLWAMTLSLLFLLNDYDNDDDCMSQRPTRPA